jgi:hypothetical protein
MPLSDYSKNPPQLVFRTDTMNDLVRGRNEFPELRVLLTHHQRVFFPLAAELVAHDNARKRPGGIL